VPLYEYQCKKCHSLTERIQKFSDPPLATCPHCGGELEQLISAPAVQFKGSGWYVTDYAKKASSGGSPGSGSGGNGSSASSSSENKTASSETKSGDSKSANSSSSNPGSSASGKSTDKS